MIHIIIFILGCCIGSFVNVIFSRKDWYKGRSRCDECGYMLKWYDLIQAFQICLDEPFIDEKGKKTKYIWLSSVDEEKGVSSGSPAHFIGDPCDESVFVTEGGLKAYVAHSLSGRTFIANAGVGNVETFREPFTILKRNGVKNVYEACDMDKMVNENVARGVKKLTDLIKEYGFNVKSMKWKWDKSNPNYNKGIDDMLLSKKK